jgi:hypothetical protein
MVRKHTRKLRRARRRTHRRGGGAWWNPFSKKPVEPQQQTFSRAKPENLAIGVKNSTRRIPRISNNQRPKSPSREGSTASLPGPIENISFVNRSKEILL